MHLLLLPATGKCVFVPVTSISEMKQFSLDDSFDRKQTNSKEQKTSTENLKTLILKGIYNS